MKSKSELVMLFASSVVCLLPIVLSLAVYSELPDQIVMQWNLEGNPNWFAHKAVPAFVMPFFFMLLNVIVRLALKSDSRREGHSKAMSAFAQWLVPFLAITVIPLMIYSAMGAAVPIHKIALVFVGLVLVFCGNYLNKNRQNVSIGIRIKWTLNDSDNWNKTHRMAGPLWVIGGIIFIIVSLLPMEHSLMLVLILSIIAVLVIVPILYSYLLYRRSRVTS